MLSSINHKLQLSLITLTVFLLSACVNSSVSLQVPTRETTELEVYANGTATVLSYDKESIYEPQEQVFLDNLTAKVPIPTSITDVLKNFVTTETNGEELIFTVFSEDVESFEIVWQGDWIYAAVSAFPTISDDISMDELKSLWGAGTGVENFSQIFIAESEMQIFSAIWGQPGSRVVLAEPDLIMQIIWNEPSSIAIIPFELITPHMKVLTVDGISVLEKGLNPSHYGLHVPYVILTSEASTPLSQRLGEAISGLPTTNRNEEQMTILLMTGVTALVRETAYKMSLQGVTYPALKIYDWFTAADIRHVSNEVSFFSGCPSPEPPWSGSRFCSPPEFLQLLDSLNIDIIELTGNHLLDYGEEAFLENLDLYSQYGYQVYGSGSNLALARKPLLIEDHGNHLAFIGCNVPGPDSVFASSSEPGAANCEMEWLLPEITTLSNEGYQVIVTFQHYEACQFEPMSLQKVDFRAAAEAGAVIVSGSQSHCTQTMTFVGDSFVHYGLGNLFFDQMWDFYRPAFIDQHIFYDGKYINTVLKTTILEDASQPRPMTGEERKVLLQAIMEASEW